MSDCKKTFEEFKARFENGEFDEQFKEVESPEDVVTMAQKLGYNISLEDVLSTELDENHLEQVAGGKKDTYHHVINYNTNVDGEGNMVVKF